MSASGLLRATVVVLVAIGSADSAWAQSRGIEIGGYGMVGRFTFTAADSFDVILGSPSGVMAGGGVRVGLPFGGLFVDVGAWRFSGDGERVFVHGGDVFTLGIPVTIAITPVEVSAGWQFRFRRVPRLRPYLAAGLTSYGYRETSQFAGAAEDVDERFRGYHLQGGAEWRLGRWLGVAGEVGWTTVADAIGDQGVSAEFNETDLGGTSLRLKIIVGR
jgi:hypothetical protein